MSMHKALAFILPTLSTRLLSSEYIKLSKVAECDCLLIGNPGAFTIKELDWEPIVQL